MGEQADSTINGEGNGEAPMPKIKCKWSFLVESDAENMQALDDEYLQDSGAIWEIPHSSIIGILKVEETHDQN